MRRPLVPLTCRSLSPERPARQHLDQVTEASPGGSRETAARTPRGYAEPPKPLSLAELPWWAWSSALAAHCRPGLGDASGKHIREAASSRAWAPAGHPSASVCGSAVARADARPSESCFPSPRFLINVQALGLVMPDPWPLLVALNAIKKFSKQNRLEVLSSGPRNAALSLGAGGGPASHSRVFPWVAFGRQGREDQHSRWQTARCPHTRGFEAL